MRGVDGVVAAKESNASHWANLAVGRWREDRRRKSSTPGGPRGMVGAAADRRWGVFSGRAGQRTAGRGQRAQLFGRWWLAAQGVEVEDEL